MTLTVNIPGQVDLQGAKLGFDRFPIDNSDVLESGCLGNTSVGNLCIHCSKIMETISAGAHMSVVVRTTTSIEPNFVSVASYAAT